MAAKNVSVIIADRHSAVRAGVRAVLEGHAKVLAEVDNGLDAVKAIRRLRPSIAILGYHLHMMNAMSVVAELKAPADRATRMILHTSMDDDSTIGLAMRHQVFGFISKSTDVHKLVTAVETVADGRHWFDDNVKLHLKRHGHLPGYDHIRPDALSKSELEIIQMIAQSMSNVEIAKTLGSSVKTVDAHRQHIYEKLGVHDVAGVTRYAIRAGYVLSEWKTAQPEADTMRVAA